MVDSHCHLADSAFEVDLGAVVSRARAAGVSRALCVIEAGDQRELARVLPIASAWPDIRFATGIHPHGAHAYEDETAMDKTVMAAVEGPTHAVAIGEIGLDYHYDLSARDRQQAVFRRQLQLARQYGLPVVIHTREADADTIAILREEREGLPGGVFHCFSGTGALLDAALDFGFVISFAGIITFPKARNLLALAARVPLDRLLVETDCPYLAPVPRRGRRNEPAWVVEVASAIAGARGERVETVEAAVAASFEHLFGLAAVPAR